LLGLIDSIPYTSNPSGKEVGASAPGYLLQILLLAAFATHELPHTYIASGSSSMAGAFIDEEFFFKVNIGLSTPPTRTPRPASITSMI
jgi:hypothetical protein